MISLFFRLVIASLLLTYHAYCETSAAAQSTKGALSHINIASYTQKIIKIQDKTKKFSRFLAMGLRRAAIKRNKALRDTLLSEGDTVFSSAIDDLNAITPPEELHSYHDKITDSYIYMALAVEALLAGNNNSAKALNLNGVRLRLEAHEELKQILARNGPPEEIVRGIISEEIIGKGKMLTK